MTVYSRTRVIRNTVNSSISVQLENRKLFRCERLLIMVPLFCVNAAKLGPCPQSLVLHFSTMMSSSNLLWKTDSTFWVISGRSMLPSAGQY